MARSRVHGPEHTPTNTDLGREIDGLKAAADESRALLVAGVQRYAAKFRTTAEGVNSPLVRVEASTNPEDPAVLRRIPARTYDIARPVGEVNTKLGVDLYGLLESLVAEMHDPHLVFERGPGQGMAQYELRTQSRSSPTFSGRNVTFLGELDHFQFKLTTLLRALLFSEAPIQPQFIKEFTGVLTMYLIEIKKIHPNLDENIETLVHDLLDPSTWEGLMEALNQNKIPNPGYTEEFTPYNPTDEIRTVLAAFAKNPNSFFKEDTEHTNPLSNPEHFLGLRSGRTILGGDMGRFVPHLPPESVTLSFGARSTAWYRYASKNPMAARQRMIDLALAIARSLRPGGVDIDDWPRGFFDSAHYTGDLVAVAKAITDDPSLRGNTRLSVIWGPSDEHPNRWAVIPKSAVITRADRPGRFPDGKVQRALLHTASSTEGKLARLTPHRLLPVGSQLEEIFGNADPQKSLEDTARAHRRRLAKMLADLRRDKP